MKQTDDFKRYEVRVENATQFLYFDGKKLPLQTMSIVKQDVDMLNGEETYCEITITVLAILKNTK